MRRDYTILLIHDDDTRRQNLEVIFDFLGEPIIGSCTTNWQSQLQQSEAFLAVIVDATVDNISATLEEVAKKIPQVPLVILGKLNDLDLKKLGNDVSRRLTNSLSEPVTYSQILAMLHHCQSIQENNSQVNNTGKNRPVPLFRSMVGSSEGIQKVQKLIDQVAKTDANVLILGESGTGKEVAARNIHARSERYGKPFIPINCGAIPPDLLESELFGHEKGAFTGAVSARQGRFELAHKGTLFLDEIGDMPMPMQVKLLRVLQERTFERVGSGKTISVDVRVIAATHRNLQEEIEKGNFREDLYYRLNVFPITMPSLRERNQDIPLLLNELIARIEGEGRGSLKILPAAIETLKSYEWPGNVRELANLVERLAILYPDGVVDSPDLPPRFQNSQPANPSAGRIEKPEETIAQLPVNGIDLKQHLVETECSLITQALTESDWVVARAADYLNMRRTTLVEKMKKYGISRPSKQSSGTSNQYTPQS